MEIRNLRTFIKIADVGNFTVAARELGYSQSNVSMQMNQLESDVGVRLFDRIGKGVSLTQQGQELLGYAQVIVSTAEMMESSLKPDAELKGQIKAGIIDSLLDACFPQVVTEFSSRFPKVRIDLDVDSSSNILQKLKRNVLDVGVLIDRPLSEDEWNCRFCSDADIGVVVGREHRLYGRKTVGAEEIRNDRFLLMEDNAPYNIQFYDMMNAEKLENNVVMKLESSHMAARIVSESASLISFLPKYVAMDLVRDGKLGFISLENYKQTQKVQVVLNRKKFVTPQINGFVETVCQTLENAETIRKTVR